MVIDTLFIYHFVDLDHVVVIFFEVEVATEQGSVDFEIRDWSIFYIKLFEIKEIASKYYVFFGSLVPEKENVLKALYIPVLSCFDYCIILICLITIKNQGKRCTLILLLMWEGIW